VGYPGNLSPFGNSRKVVNGTNWILSRFRNCENMANDESGDQELFSRVVFGCPLSREDEYRPACMNGWETKAARFRSISIPFRWENDEASRMSRVRS
jgi:hypothetical protein